jgi:hypothetical protein
MELAPERVDRPAREFLDEPKLFGVGTCSPKSLAPSALGVIFSEKATSAGDGALAAGFLFVSGFLALK